MTGKMTDGDEEHVNYNIIWSDEFVLIIFFLIFLIPRNTSTELVNFTNRGFINMLKHF